ncbi:MAG: CDP-diacylglycerol--glycerol-3-phosphate 3-phosphatidyltransferase [Rhodospirillales bacterium]
MIVNIPNILTMSRIAAIPVVIAIFFLDDPLGSWLAMSFYVLVCITDFFDGHLARAMNQQSAFGRFLDPIADKLLVAAVIFTLVGVGRIEGFSVIAAAVILCREILVSGLREFLAEVRVSVPVSRLAKWKTGIQMAMLGILLVGPAGPDFIILTTQQIGVIGLWLAALLTLITGYDYLRAGLRHINETDRAPAP